MKKLKHFASLAFESFVWLVAIWGSCVAFASILKDWQTTERTYIGIVSEAVEVLPLTLLYLIALNVSIILLLFCAGIIVSLFLWGMRERGVLPSHSFSSFKILLFIIVALTCLDFVRLGFAMITTSIVTHNNSLESVKFDETLYIYVDQFKQNDTYEITVSDLNGTHKTVLASFKRADIGVPLYVSPNGKFFLTVKRDKISDAERLQIRNIDGTIAKEMSWTGGQFLNFDRLQVTLDNLSALWTSDGSALVVMGKENDGSKQDGTFTIFNVQNFSEKISTNIKGELMDTDISGKIQRLMYNDRVHIRDYYVMNISADDTGLKIGEPEKLVLGQCFSANKDVAFLGDDLYCLTSTLLYNHLESKRNPDFPNADKLLIHQKLSQDNPDDFSVLSPIIANPDYWIATSDNKYLITYHVDTYNLDDGYYDEDKPKYQTIVYEVDSGRQYKIQDENSPLYGAKPVAHRFLKFTGEI